MQPNTSAKQRNFIPDIICLAVLFFIFYTLWLGSYPVFTPDEGRYPEVAREMVASGDYITPRVNGVAFLDKPILYYWLQAASIYLFGVKEWAIRLFPALLGVIGCLVTYGCGRLLFNRRTGLISAILLATSPLFFIGGHYANLDLEVAVFISCTLLFFISAVQSHGKTKQYLLVAAYLCAAFAFLTKGLIGIAFPAMIAGSWIILLWRWDILKKIHLIAGIGLFLALTLPWYILVQKANPEFLHYFFVTQQVSRFLSAGTYNNVTPIWFYAPIILAGFFPWTIFLVQALFYHCKKVWAKRQQHQTELFLLLWLVIVFTFFSIPHSKIVSYILPVFPAIALLVGNYLSTIWHHASRRSVYFAIASFNMIAVILDCLLIIAHHHEWLNFSVNFLPYLVIIATILLMSAVASLLLIRSKTMLPLFIICVACSTGFLLTLTLSAPTLNQNSAKPLVSQLKTLMKPEDEVVNYFKFYQDVPLYLGQRITIVADWESPNIALNDNWKRELWYGMAFQKTDDWLINENAFWKRWESGKRMFVFVNANYFDKFKSGTKHYVIVGRHNDIILLSNINEKPTTY